MADYEIADLGLAEGGRNKINWNEGDMPVLLGIRERFRKEQPLRGMKVSVCLHITAKTAALVRTLSAGGADVTLVASNPLSTQDDVAASLVVMDRKWTEVFRQILGKSERSLVNELVTVRNAWAHQEPFSSDDAYRALDSAGRLLSAVSAAQVHPSASLSCTPHGGSWAAQAGCWCSPTSANRTRG